MHVYTVIPKGALLLLALRAFAPRLDPRAVLYIRRWGKRISFAFGPSGRVTYS
jgi:hypothetical protein